MYRFLRLLYMYEGKYDSAIKIMDEIIRIDKQLKENHNLTRSYGQKAHMLIAGHNDIEDAKEAIQQGLSLRRAAGGDFYGLLFNTYLSLGEYEKAAALENQVSSIPYSDVMLRAYQQRSKGNSDKAVKDFQLVSRKGEGDFRIKCGYELSRSYYEIGKYDQAIEAVRRLQNIHSNFMYWEVDEGSPLYLFERAIFYPKSFYLLGKIYEKKGDTQLANENYEKFLDLWKDADKDLPDLIDAKERLAKLVRPGKPGRELNSHERSGQRQM